MLPLPTLGALLAACCIWLLLCCCGVTESAFTSPYILTPMAAVVAAPTPRLEIRNLMADPYQATLFIRSLLILQGRSYTRLDSYTRMAAVHGSSGTFDGVTLGTSGSGYCVHGRPFFGPWHRPYLMMVEQAFYELANAYAALYTTADKDRYLSAARDMRLPYWDWGSVGGQVPAIFLQPNYEVTLENGTKSIVRNPLNRWTITTAAPGWNLVGSWQSITRDSSWSTTTSPVYLPNISQLRAGLVSMFKATSFACFVNNPVPSTCPNSGSLEGLHNTMHVNVGGNSGHMSYTNYAAFDPIFFLHHCNVDRHLAIWEGIYPTATMDTIAGSTAYPFRRSSTTWWTTRNVMNVYDASRQGSRRFGYYYPEFANASITPNELLAKVDQLYNDAVGQAITVVSLAGTDSTTVDGVMTVSIAPAVATTTTADRADTGKTTRRTRRTVVRAGTVRISKRSSHIGRFTVSRADVDITGALAKLKAANPNLTSVDIVATVTPYSSNASPNSQPTQIINLGKPIITKFINGRVVATTAPQQPATASKVNNAAAHDVKLFEATGEVKAMVVP